MSNSFWPHGLQHIRLLCPSLSPRVCSNSCPLSQWCYLTISSSAAPFSGCLQSFSASGSFLMSQLFTLGGQSIGASASTSVLQWIFRVDFLRLTGLISLQSNGLSRVFSSTTIQKQKKKKKAKSKSKRKLSGKELMFLSCGVGEGSWESLGLQGNQTSQS